ncbi:hypothetical protein SBJ83_001658 [Campylobacter jejuni]|nr:hypothetical protein [Campylobacter jejuni]
MILARIYPFTRKDIKMKLDRVKEEIANIRQWKNICCVAFMGTLAYFFTEVQPDPTIRTVSACITTMVLGFWLFILCGKMKKKLDELEKLKKDE